MVTRYFFIDPDNNVLDLNDRINTWVTRGVSGHIMSPSEIYSYEVPFEMGEFVTDVSIKAREFVLPVLVACETRALFLEKIRAMAHAFNPKRGVGKIRIITNDGKSRDLNCRYKYGFGGNTDGRGNSPGSGYYYIAFRASDPVFYETTPFTDTFNIFENISPDPFFPFFPLRLSASGIFNVVTIQNTGNFDAYPIWRVYGVGSTPIIKNITTNKEIKVSTSLADDTEYIEIDTRPFKKSIFRNDGTNELPLMTEESTMFPLIVGNNQIQIELSGADANSYVTVSFNMPLMGI